MAWLWNSMMPEVCGPHMFLTTTKDIWESVRQTYSKVKDVALIYEIKTRLSMTKQGTLMLIRAEEGRRIVMLDVPNIEGFAMMITNSKNPSDAINAAEMMKNEGKLTSKDDQFCN
uniref:Uncharacterized protein n=1 Tax=Salix viminalis TaxID=40686 RepID=A0A6N2LDD4_SALVM